MNKLASISFFIVVAFFSACKSLVTVQTKDLYDQKDLIYANEINGFKAVNIFYDDYDKSVWQSPEKNCVQLNTEKINVYSGKFALNVKWDKIEGGCKWIGIGFGWNNWMAKDILDITKVAAIQMQVKSVKGSFKNFPVAFALEDYSGVQCYYGFREELAAGVFNDTSWTSVTIPLSKFDFEGKKFDTEKVKQFIIQLEGDGNIYLDNIKFIKI
jgi:hypothetical protein